VWSKPRTTENASYRIRVIGAARLSWGDLYYAVLRWRWSVTLAAIAAVYLAANALFAFGYLITGGVANMMPGSFKEAFFFSVQTMGTIGYGALFPRSDAANGLVVTESLTGLLLTALAAGLVFAKASRSTARFVFTEQAVIGPINGIPTLSLRIGNARGNQIVNAEIRLVLVRTEHTPEGRTFYRMVDLPLTRERALSLSRSWTVIHPIDQHSPLGPETAVSLVEKGAELLVMVVGLDDTFMQQVHGTHRYFAHQILWGHRHVDVLSETETGDLVLDLRKFHQVEPISPTEPASTQSHP
jgi:inward rectifier potassium channel